MSQPWFDPAIGAGAIGGVLGVTGGVLGALIGVYASKGKRKGLVLGLHLFLLVVCAICTVAGLVAQFVRQPDEVSQTLLRPGFVGLCILAFGLPWVRKLYRKAEPTSP